MKKVRLTKAEIKKRLETEPDFVNSPKHGYSLQELEKVNPNGVNDRFAATLLAISMEEFQALIRSTIEKYRRLLKIDVD